MEYNNENRCIVLEHNGLKLQELTLRECQIATLEVYKMFSELCKKIGVKYSIAFGTLIGAVRHKGYVPWDDDFDIVMPRADYDKFLKYCSEHKGGFSPKYEIHNKYTIENCRYNITRFCCNDYKLLFYIWPGYESGLFIDIYPLDGLGKSNDYKYWQKNSRKMLGLQKMVSLTFKPFYPKNYPLWKKVRNKIFKFFFVHKSANYYLSKLDKIGQKFSWDESDYVYCTVWTQLKRIPQIRKEIFEDLVEFDFEGVKVPGPKDYDEFLRPIYEDYMKLPPLELQQPHHGYKVYKIIK